MGWPTAGNLEFAIGSSPPRDASQSPAGLGIRIHWCLAAIGMGKAEMLLGLCVFGMSAVRNEKSV